MKILIACVLLSTLSLTFATPLSALKNSLASEQSDEVKALLQTLTNNQNTEDSDGDDGEEDIANLQGVFNVLAQVNAEKAKATDEDDAMAQFWKLVRRGLWHVGKRYLKKKYCTEEQEMNALLQELTGEQQGLDDEDNGDKEEKAMAELQYVFSALKKAEAKAMLHDATTDLNADAEGWFKRFRRSIKRRIKGATRRYLC